MGGYELIERDFISRTLEVLKQYDKFKLTLQESEQYEVTLLINSLLGLLLYPKQLIDNKQDLWLSDQLFVNVAFEWGLEKEYVKNAGWTNKQKIEVFELSMIELLRNMRNAAAHAHFSAQTHNGQISEIILGKNRPQTFYMIIPVNKLRGRLKIPVR